MANFIKSHKLLKTIITSARYIAQSGIGKNSLGKSIRPRGPRCTEVFLDKTPFRTNNKKAEIVSPLSWENPECYVDRYKAHIPRLDELHYKTSNKAKRIYTQTWIECPIQKIIPKRVCCFENLKYPQLEKRKRKVVTAKCVSGKDLDLKCHLGSKNCIRIVCPGCRAARYPPSCSKSRFSDCQRVSTPYPSFSECSRLRPKPKKHSECYNPVTMCEAYEYMKKYGLTFPNPRNRK